MESPSTCPQVCLEKPSSVRCGFLAVAGAAPLSSEHMDLHHLPLSSEQLIICWECYLNCPIWYFTPAKCHLQEIRDTACASSVSSWPLALSIVLWSQTHLPQKTNGHGTAFLPAVKDPAVAGRSFFSLALSQRKTIHRMSVWTPSPSSRLGYLTPPLSSGGEASGQQGHGVVPWLSEVELTGSGPGQPVCCYFVNKFA